IGRTGIRDEAYSRTHSSINSRFMLTNSSIIIPVCGYNQQSIYTSKCLIQRFWLVKIAMTNVNATIT
ncbi:hypothetical protein NS188_23115, partial [Enterobacter cancerogenus]